MAYPTTVEPVASSDYHPRHRHHHPHHHHQPHPRHPHAHAHAHVKKRQAPVHERTVVVFDWDDTLCPSSWLHAQDLLPKYRGQQILVSPAQRRILDVLADHVVRVLKKAVSYGPVFIVTAAETGWVELSCALYLPGVQALLAMNDIHTVSARSWYEQTYGPGGDSASWKHEVMHLIASKCFVGAHPGTVDGSHRLGLYSTPETYFNFVSIGDSLAERDACHAATARVAWTLAKTLKFIEHPTPEELGQQIGLTQDSFDQMCGWENNLDLRLTRAQLAQLRYAHGST